MGIREDLLELSVEIGPRGACTPAEEKAARYVAGRFAETGLAVDVREFSCMATRSWLYLIHLFVAVACGVLSHWYVCFAAPLAVLNALAFALELETYPVLSRLLPRGRSRNVTGEIPCEDGSVALVLVAHCDSARAGFPFGPSGVGGPRTWLSLMVAAVLLSAALSFSNLVVRVAAGRASSWIWVATLVFSVYLVLPAAFVLRRELAMGFTPGANDNASGVVAMLSIADKAGEEESRVRGVMFVATGAGEAGAAGMVEFLRENGARLRDALIVNLDTLGACHLCYIDVEGVLLGHQASPELLWLSKRVAEKQRLPVWRTGYRAFAGDATAALARGYRAMSLMAFDDSGSPPNRHSHTDTAENVDMENIELARAFLWNMLRRVDP